MAWYRNHYHCGDCGTDWKNEWSCCCDDECPECGSRHWSAVDSEDLTEVVCKTSDGYAIMRSSAAADDKPRYQEACVFPSKVQAERFVRNGELI